MKKKSILFVILFCFFYCITAFASDKNNENNITTQKFIDITNVEKYQINKPSEELTELETFLNELQKNKITQKESKTLSSYNIDDVKKVHLYDEDLFDKIEKGLPLRSEDRYIFWEVPIGNADGQNGILSIGRSQKTKKLKIEATSYPIKKEKIYLSNDEILDIIYHNINENQYIEDILFAQAPLNIEGALVAIVKTNTNTFIIPVENTSYYHGEEIGKIYTISEMKTFQNKIRERMGNYK